MNGSSYLSIVYKVIIIEKRLRFFHIFKSKR